MIHFISVSSTKMEYRNFTNCKIASIVSFAITFNCEEARRMFLEQFGKEPPPVCTFRDWKARFLETLTTMPCQLVGDHRNRRLSTEKKEVLTPFGYDPFTSQQEHCINCNQKYLFTFMIVKQQEDRDHPIYAICKLFYLFKGCSFSKNSNLVKVSRKFWGSFELI